jgi:hypothetical protein
MATNENERNPSAIIVEKPKTTQNELPVTKKMLAGFKTDNYMTKNIYRLKYDDNSP